MNWEIIIGLETHVQLSTVSKLFSGASTRFGALPNMQASVVDLALPGVLPVANRGAVERAILFGLAINARIAPQSVLRANIISIRIYRRVIKSASMTSPLYRMAR